LNQRSTKLSQELDVGMKWRCQRLRRGWASQGLKHMVEIKVGAETINATYNHPFWVQGKHQFEWAIQLKQGDHLLMPDSGP
jgi:hypothetical protein